MKPSISDVEATGTTRSQEDDPISFASRLDLFSVYWEEQSRHETRFSQWLEKQDERDRVRLERIASCTRIVEKDRAKVERQTLIDRGVYRGRR